MSFRVEDLLTKFQNQSFPTISKAGDVRILESRLVVLVVVTEDDFAIACLYTLNWRIFCFVRAGCQTAQGYSKMDLM